MANFYETLGVSKDATQAEIKGAFRKKARELHPDVNKAPEAEAQFKELGKAYETLSNEEKRSLYDKYGEEGLSNAGYDSNGPFDFGFGNINDIFESFFGGMGGMGGFGGGRAVDPNAPQHGHDLRLDIELEFEEAAFGIEKEIKIDHLEMCKECYGTGAEPGTKPTVCQECNGQGRVVHMTRTILGSIQQVATCQKCGGTGQVIGSPCKKCSGEGRLEVEKTVKIKIPAGVDNNAKIRVAKEGDAGKNGGVSGDLYIVMYVKAHKSFKRDGFNVYSELLISFPQAVLGDTVQVETIHGEKELVVPSGIEYGKILTIRNAGIPYLGHPEKRGDHLVLVKYKAPKSLNEEEKRLYKKLFELSENKKPNEKLIDKFKSAIHS